MRVVSENGEAGGSTLTQTERSLLVADDDTSPLGDEGNPAQLAGVQARLQRAEATLLRKEEECRQLQRMARVGYWSIDLASGKIDWSDLVYELFERDPALGPPTYEEHLAYYHPRDSVRLRKQFRLVVDSGREVGGDFQVKLPSGRIAWHDGSSFAVQDKDGMVVGLIGTVQDISGRKRIEEEHLESKLNLEIFLNATRESALLLSRDGTILLANTMVSRRLGISNDELVGMNIDEIFSDHVARSRRQQMERVIRSGQAVHFEDQRRGRVFSNSIYPIFDRSGDIDRFAVLAVDVTESHRTQHQVEGLNRLRESLLSFRPLEEKLHRITNGLVEIFGADLARFWVIRPGDRFGSGCTHGDLTEGPHVCRHRNRCLHLLASSGRYTHLDGRVHQRVPFGCYKIGQLAGGEESKFMTNEVTRDPRVHDHEWAGSLGLVSFAGYRVLSPAGSPVGVLALFSKRPISPEEDQLIESLSATASQVLETDSIEREREGLIAELQHSISEIRQLSEMLPICASCKKVRDDQGYWSAIEQYIGEHAGTQFSHGICPDCARELYPDYFSGEE
jgi:PAS domain S-box-containing protein